MIDKAEGLERIKMERGQIRLQKVIVHILDSEVGMPVMSDALLAYGSDF